MTALARTSDPSTSHQAAATVNRPRSQQLVLDTLALGPMTDDYLAWLCSDQYSGSRIRTARKELERLSLVVDTGRTEETARGKRAIVWAVAA